LRPKPKKKKQRAVVDTNVVVAGISGFRDQYIPGQIPSADLLHRWAEEEHLVRLYSEDILAEYKEVLNRLHVRSAVIGTLINFIRERGESVERPRFRPIPKTMRSVSVPRKGARTSSSLSTRKTFHRAA
jgi:predicted nucleic acid-binding protein